MSDEFDTLEWLLNGKPVPLTIDGCEFALRQPKPLEVDRLQFQQTRAYDRALADYRADNLDKEPVSAALAETMRVYNDMQEAAFKTANETGDSDAAYAIAADMDRSRGQWPKSLAEERARDYARRTVARFIVDTLLEGDKAAWRELTAPDPLERSEVTAAVQRLLSLINHDPNSNRRKA